MTLTEQAVKELDRLDHARKDATNLMIRLDTMLDKADKGEASLKQMGGNLASLIDKALQKSPFKVLKEFMITARATLEHYEHLTSLLERDRNFWKERCKRLEEQQL